MAGVLASAFPLGQFVAGVVVGRLSDATRNRKTYLVVGVVANVLLYPVFGYMGGTPSLLRGTGVFWALVALRFVQGAVNNNIGLLRAAMGE
eukprot:CAMPEP_0198326828 /NCGR_PEP_ID=MMETSP1450-20131203/14251_1 /TAXON_ID=753684 ORGANISM="Madagascaria erythrocladiodes, Strain CCMP3234" /NCGR_SAMPLE_ID=MMETSP1450 /ASSEMBLY_ACC=CAM_ASM_001115 /LENGTH=90 /DNA_ID=CAMNT_0044030827 /DNA_START=1 /DNA_END=270 /DNA_ORIENTATION=-